MEVDINKIDYKLTLSKGVNIIIWMCPIIMHLKLFIKLEHASYLICVNGI